MDIYKFNLAVKNETSDRFTHYNEEIYFAVNPATGVLELNYDFITTDAIEFLNVEKFYFENAYIIAFYDSTQNFIKSVVNDTPQRITYNIVNVPENARYFRVSGKWHETNVDPVICPAFDVKPIYKSDVNITASIETNQRFYRNELSGKFTFVRDDYRRIRFTPFESTYIMMLWLSEDTGATWTQLFRGKFSRTDCKIDEDDQSIEVSAAPLDDYTAVLAGMEKEYNLVELAPEIDPITISRRPLTQLYVPGDNVVTCFLSGMSWEQDAEPQTSRKVLIGTYHYRLTKILKKITVTQSTFGANGRYIGGLDYIEEGTQSTNPEYIGKLYDNDNATFYMYLSIVARDQMPTGDVICEIRTKKDDEVYYRYERVGGGEFDNKTFILETPVGSGRYDTVNAEMISTEVYARFITDNAEVEGTPTYDLMPDDMVGNNRNYSHVIGIKNAAVFLSANYSDEPTEWGRRDNGTYFAPPYDITGRRFYPVSRTMWLNESIWYQRPYGDDKREEGARKEYELRDAFPLWSVINVLLKKIAPGIKHEGTAEYSQFLYGERNPLSGDKFRVYISPKSNIINGEYQTPAQKSPITLKAVTEMLQNVYKCFWYIEDGKFKIEHVEYFRRGGSYTENPVVGYDLTQMGVLRNGKKWAFDTSAYTFDKYELPERYEFEWMDDVSEYFAGYPIVIKSLFVAEEKVDKINVGQFTSDVDIMLINPAEMSNDGFALFATVDANIITEQYTPGALIVEGTDGAAMPTVPINPGHGGRDAILKVICTGGGTGKMYFILDDGTLSPTVATITSTGSEAAYEMTIPEGAVSFALSAFGTIRADIRGLYVPGVRELPFVKQTINGTTYVLQNGLVAFCNLQPKYWLYDAPAFNLIVNGAPVRAQTIQRKKKQEVRFPALWPIEPRKVIKTNIGNGEIEKISVNLCSKQAKTTLMYDTAEQ